MSRAENLRAERINKDAATWSPGLHTLPFYSLGTISLMRDAADSTLGCTSKMYLLSPLHPSLVQCKPTVALHTMHCSAPDHSAPPCLLLIYSVLLCRRVISRNRDLPSQTLLASSTESGTNVHEGRSPGT